MRKWQIKRGGRGKAYGRDQHVDALETDRVSMTGIPDNCTDILKGHLVLLCEPKPLLNPCAVKLTREGVAGKEVLLQRGGGQEKVREGGRSAETEGSTPVIASSSTQSGIFRMA
jgi:hypothetical protein